MIQLKGIAKQYKKKRVAGPLDIEIHKGESVALVGGNGAGKSTTLRMIAGLLKPTQGTIEIEGFKAGTKQAKKMMFYLPQKMVLPTHMTLKESVLFFAKLHNIQTPDLKKLTQNYQLSDVVEERIGTFSGGMMQRLGLLIVDCVNSPILLLDEPTSNLDRAGIALFFERMDAWRKSGRTIVFASHATAEINELADRCIVLESGRVQETYVTSFSPSAAKEGYAHA